MSRTVERRERRQVDLGLPVDRLTGLQRIVCAEGLDAALLARHPGCFFVACGLALQGVGESPLCVNLYPRSLTTAFAKAAGLLRVRLDRSRCTAWGIDIGRRALKAVKLKRHGPKRPVSIEAVDFRQYRKPLGQAANQLEEQTLLHEALEAMADKHDMKADRLCVSLPGRLVLSRQFVVPPAAGSKLRSLVCYEARSQLPFSLEELVWDYQLLDDPVAKGDSPIFLGGKSGQSPSQLPADKKPAAGAPAAGGLRTVLVVAAKRNQVENLCGSLRQADLKADLVQSDCLALHNFLSYEFFHGESAAEPPAAPQPGAIAALDLGHETTNVVVGSHSGVWSMSIGVGGHAFTRALVRQFSQTFSQAEQQKHNPASAPSLSQLYAALEPVMADLAGEIRLALAAFAKAHPRQPVGRIVGLGGGFDLHGLWAFLRCGP
jgi:type IV pilus assembly protein PilM